MTEPFRLHERGQSAAVLIGTWDYAHLRSVPAVRHSMDRIYHVLTGPAIGWPKADITRIDNPANPGDLADRLMTGFDGVSDVALFYYVGHGQDDHNGELCLGLGGSRPELHRRAATSLEYRPVREALRHSKASVKIVILDCCYSGIAVDPAHSLGSLSSAAERVLLSTHQSGAYVITASSAHQEAWCEVDAEGGREPQTYFTRYLADTVEQGVANQPAHLTLGLLFEAVKERLVADRLPTPQMRSVNNPEGYFFTRNLAPPETHNDPWETNRRLEAEVARLQALIAVERRTRDADVSAAEHDLHERQADIADLRAANGISPAASGTHAATDAALANLRATPTPKHERPVPPPLTPSTPTALTSGSFAPAIPGRRAGISSELRRLRESAGAPSTADIARLTRRNGTPLNEPTIHEIMTGQRVPSIDETLAVASACGVYADETGRRLPSSDYDGEAWRTRHERLVPAPPTEAQAEPASANQLIVPTAPPERRLIVPTGTPKGPQAEEVREARRLEEEGRHRDAERMLLREARNGSVEAKDEIAAMYRRQGRRDDYVRALREAEDAGSARAAKALERLRRARGDTDPKS